MAAITIRNIDDDLKRRLRVRAAEQGRSMEEEAREILRSALPDKAELHLVDRIRARVEPTGGFVLEVPPREPVRDPRFPKA